MKMKLLGLVAALALLGIAPLVNADVEEPDDDRSTTYAGTTRQDHGLNEVCDEQTGQCPVIIPSGDFFSSCDFTDGLFGSGINGVGGASFCGVRTGTTINVTLHDEILDVPVARITCYSHTDSWGDPIMNMGDIHWYMDLGTAAPNLEIEVPGGCGNKEPEKGEDLTEIVVFLNVGSATVGEVTLEYL